MEVAALYTIVLALLLFFTGGVTAIDRELERLKSEIKSLRKRLESLEAEGHKVGAEAERSNIDEEILRLYDEGRSVSEIAEELKIPHMLVVDRLSRILSREGLEGLQQVAEA